MRRAAVPVALLAVAMLAGGVAGCGKKSSLEPPPGEPSHFPRVYPTPQRPPLPQAQGPRSAMPQPTAAPQPDDRQLLPPLPMQNRILPQ